MLKQLHYAITKFFTNSKYSSLNYDSWVCLTISVGDTCPFFCLLHKQLLWIHCKQWGHKVLEWHCWHTQLYQKVFFLWAAPRVNSSATTPTFCTTDLFYYLLFCFVFHKHSWKTTGKFVNYNNVHANITKDWLNTETTKMPPVLIVVPRAPKSQDFLLDIKYTDFTGIQDIPNGYPAAECYIIPPYKHLMHVAMYSPNVPLDVYALRGK